MSWKRLAVLVLAVACLSASGCATTSQTGTLASNEAPDRVGPDYYSSSDNPFHAD